MAKQKPDLADAARENPTYATIETTRGPRRFDVTTRDDNGTILYRDVLHANVTWGEIDRILAELGLQMDPAGGWRKLSGELRARVVPVGS